MGAQNSIGTPLASFSVVEARCTSGCERDVTRCRWNLYFLDSIEEDSSACELAVTAGPPAAPGEAALVVVVVAAVGAAAVVASGGGEFSSAVRGV